MARESLWWRRMSSTRDGSTGTIVTTVTGLIQRRAILAIVPLRRGSRLTWRNTVRRRRLHGDLNLRVISGDDELNSRDNFVRANVDSAVDTSDVVRLLVRRPRRIVQSASRREIRYRNGSGEEMLKQRCN